MEGTRSGIYLEEFWMFWWFRWIQRLFFYYVDETEPRIGAVVWVQ
jgi:hypothetical protein